MSIQKRLFATSPNPTTQAALATQAAILLRGQVVRHDHTAIADPAAYTAAYRALVRADAA